MKIFYPIESLPNSLQILITTVNPMYYYVRFFRDVALYGQLPSARIFWGCWIWGIVMMIIGLWVFQKNKDRFILYI